MDIDNINWYGHDTFSVITASGLMVYFDPYHLPVTSPKADYILVSHEHFDHCSPEDIEKVSKSDTKVIAAPQAAETLKLKDNIMKPGDELSFENVEIKAVPAYNIDKFREPDVPFHPKADNKVGFIVKLDNRRYYHAGDTDNIPEMTEYKCDIAFLPVSGTYVMTAQEAAAAADSIQPELAIPMHYGSIIGSLQDAEKFRELTKVPVRILDKS